MLALIVFIVLAIAALIVFSVFVHILFSPWLLLVAVAIVLFVKFGRRRARR
jgi:hypothetical protein